MYALGAAGKALGGLTAAGTDKLLAAAISKAPFVSSAMGNYFTQAIASGASRDDATFYAMVAGTAEGLLESLSMGEILDGVVTNKIVINKILRASTKAAARVNIAKFGAPLVHLLASTIGEFAEESASEIISGLMRRATWDKTYQITAGEVGEAGLMGAAIGFIMAAAGMPATSRQHQQIVAMMQAPEGFAAHFDNLVATTIAESLKPETLAAIQPNQLTREAVAGLIASSTKNSRHAKAETERYRLRMEKLDADVEKVRSKAERLSATFKGLDPNSPTYAKDFGETAKQMISTRENLAQVIASTDAQKQAATKDYDALIARLSNENANYGDQLNGHFVGRYAAMEAQAEAVRQAENTGTDGFGNPIQYELPDDAKEVLAAQYITPEIEQRLAEMASIPSTISDMSPERQQYRIDKANEYYNTYRASKQERQAYIVIGPPAAGKSTIANPLVQSTGSILIDSDIVKMGDAKTGFQGIPEYGTGDGAGAVHDESSFIADNVLDLAVENGDNIVYPKVGGKADNIRALAADLRTHGYTTHLILNELPIEKAMERNNNRYRETGRLVNPKYLMNIGNKPIRTFLELQQEGAFDNYERYSNDVERGFAPVPILERHPGRGRVLRHGGSGGRDNAGGDQAPPGEAGGSTAGPATPGGIQDLGANTPTPVDLKESRLYTNTYDKILSELEKAADSTDKSLYAVQHEADTMAIAQELVRGALEREGSVDSLAAMLKRAEAWGPTDVDTAMLILNTYRTEASDSGDFSKVNEWKGIVREHTTESAQALQAFAKWSRNTTEGALINAERVAANLNETYKDAIQSGKMQQIVVDEALLTELAQAETTEDRNAVLDAIAQHIADQVPASLADKLTAWRYLSMLGNPRTHARNILGNVFMAGLRQAKNAVGTAIESVAIKDPSQRTKSILTKADSALVDYAKSTWEDASVAFEGDKFDGSRKGLEKLVQDKRTIFNTKALEKARRFNLEALEWEDIALFAQPAYVDAYAKVMKARGLTSETITAPQRAELMQIAADEALKATFRDTNALADLLNKIERSGVAGKLLVAGTIPFKKTPLNVLKRGVEYSPIGLVQGVAEVFTKVQKGKMAAAEAIDHISAGTVGTGLMAVGMLLTKAGILRASGEEDDKYEYYLRDMGEQPYSIKIVDMSFTVDWITPASMPLFMGAELYNAAIGRAGTGTALESVISSLAQTTDPIMQLSMLQGINDMLEAVREDKGLGGALGAIAASAAYNYAGQFVPTISGQIARTIDPVRRTTTGDPNAPWGKTLDKASRKLLGKIPFASAANEPYINVRGEEVGEDGWMLRLAENMLLPGYVDKADMRNVDKEVIRLFAETGEPSVIPRNYPQRTLKKSGKEYTLSNDEYTQFKKAMGARVYRALDSAIRTGEYATLTDAGKAKLLKNTILNAQDDVREEYKNRYVR